MCTQQSQFLTDWSFKAPCLCLGCMLTQPDIMFPKRSWQSTGSTTRLTACGRLLAQKLALYTLPRYQALLALKRPIDVQWLNPPNGEQILRTIYIRAQWQLPKMRKTAGGASNALELHCRGLLRADNHHRQQIQSQPSCSLLRPWKSLCACPSRLLASHAPPSQSLLGNCTALCSPPT